jgi:hypothetical protein
MEVLQLWEVIKEACKTRNDELHKDWNSRKRKIGTK